MVEFQAPLWGKGFCNLNLGPILWYSETLASVQPQPGGGLRVVAESLETQQATPLPLPGTAPPAAHASPPGRLTWPAFLCRE